jgi:hypothetical protein
MSANRLAGHGLVAEGAAFASVGVRSYWGSDPGMALCECGTYSPRIKNRAQRKQWHRDHKDDIRAGGDGVVWADGAR